MRSTLAHSVALLVLAAPLTAQVKEAQALAPQQDSVAKADAAGRARDARRLTGVVVRERAVRRSYALPDASLASKLQGPVRDMPQSIAVVGKALIADQAMQTMADVVRYVPGIGMAQGEGHRDAPIIRGNTSTADFFVDGVRDDGQYLRDVYNVERIEALKGSNAMAFGRGGGGGVINRVTKDASWAPTRVLTLEGGSYAHRRATADVGGAVTSRIALRLNGLLERSALFREASGLDRFGINPTAAIALDDRTTLRLGVERFDDRRTTDRGIPSLGGLPVDVPTRTFFGDPDVSRSTARVMSGTAALSHLTSGGVTLTSRTRAARYDKWYRNVYAGAVNAAGTDVALQGYASDVLRDNLLTQAEAAYTTGGAVQQHLLAGVELGVQATNNYRRTAYFGAGSATTYSVPVSAPSVSTPVSFRQSASDADNRAVAHVASGYVQDQVELGDHLRAVAGLRLDRFALAYTNRRDGSSLARDDRMLSPRVGLVLKPSEPLSFYGTMSVSALPSSGDQFSSLTVTTATLEPERFVNREVGVKWDALRDLSLTAAAYRLDRSNTSAPDPLDATHVVQTGRQRSTGLELGASGSVNSRWQLQGGLAAQHAYIVDRTSAAVAGATVPLVPRRTASLWNRYLFSERWSAGLGLIHQGASFAAIDNTVTLPAFTRADAALYASLAGVRAQVNLENLLGTRYYATSQGNNNIMPGAPRVVRVSASF